MRIGLIDVDSTNFPNLALMKISAFHKANGDSVEFYTPFSDKYDVVYKAKVFSFSPDYLDYVNAHIVIKGGTGYEIQNIAGRESFHALNTLPSMIENIYPDYSLYNITDTAYGFLTRGCPRQCYFCHVASKEGTSSYTVSKLEDFWHGQKNIVLMDPNILACKDKYQHLDALAKSGAYIDFNQGLDARLLNEKVINLLNEIKIKEIHFAWDRFSDGKYILPKLEMYSKMAHKKHGHNAIVYVLCNFDTTIEQDLERIYTLRELGYWAYVMIYDKAHCAPVYRDLQRWCNNRFIFGSCPRFEDYNKKIIPIEQNQLTLF